MYNNEKLNRILYAVPKDDPQNKINVTFLLKLIEDLINASGDGERLRIANDIKILLESE